ncbi:MAG: threonine synthase [Dysgonamonadaceae bacterium]|nr:threonine synthase [Dysgonamonadaceae bacterium]MDD3308718.1 threonine synthase [Dysgonamonadaceae bacterium]MDD4399244.1 threonine synthase [Dysgonamonadaceae bacterium]
MKYYSTNHKAPEVSLQEAVIKGLAPDKGLYMPKSINHLSKEFIDNIGSMNLTEIGKTVANAFFGEDIPEEDLSTIVSETLNFAIPLKKVEEGIYVLELFHGPTFAFKDVGARFMARLLSYFVKKQHQENIKVLVATSGDTGSAVANGFLGVEGIQVIVLYPSGKVSNIQESQFTTLGQNITALEIDGTFDDCQRLVKSMFLDKDLNKQMNLTSANSINVARFLPQSFYYFYGYAQLVNLGISNKVVYSVPSGNLGNLTAGLFAKKMGLPIHRFFAANNKNDTFFNYLKTGDYQPKPSIQTIANAMDVGAPSNFDRIIDLYRSSYQSITKDITGFTYTDDEIKQTINDVYTKSGYLLDPHGACAYKALKDKKEPDETGIFLATAHPAKFKEIVEQIIDEKIDVPEKLESFTKKSKLSIKLPSDTESVKNYLIQQS